MVVPVNQVPVHHPVGDEIFRGILDVFLGRVDGCSSFSNCVLPELIGQRFDFLPNDLPPSRSVGVFGVFAKQSLDLIGAFLFVLQFIKNQIDFQTREPIQLELQYGVGLFRIQPAFVGRKTLHNLLRRVRFAI